MKLSDSRKKIVKRPQGVSAVSRPSGMSLEHWQRLLRRQAAGKEPLVVKAPTAASDDPFIVRSGKSGRSYRVHYFGPSSPANRCECMDFKTSRLGTCKHIEAITLAANGRFARRNYPPLRHTTVYVDYVGGRTIRIRRGSATVPEMDTLIATLFNSDGKLRDLQCDPSGFIREAKRIEEGFEWEQDALNLLIEERDRIRRKKIIEEKYRDSLFDGLLKTTLHPYQAEGVRFAFEGGRTINADEMGLGKTVQAIATAELLQREGLVDSVIIICPTSLKYQWLSEIRRFTDSSAVVVEGNAMKRREIFDGREHFYKICSFHAMSNSIKGGFLPQADMIIYDELQRLKNKETQMGKQLRKLDSLYVMALSGTPLENKLDELYSVTQLVDQFVLGPYYKFTSETTLTDDTGKIVGYTNLHAIAERLKDTLIRRKKSEVRLQMPARTDTILYVPMTREQRAMHDEYKFQVTILVDKWRKFKFLSERDRKQLLLLLSMMRMVCDSTYILDQKSRFDTKIDEVMAIISNLLSDEEGKVVIFSQWERMLRILATTLDNEGVDFCFLHGGVPSAKRKDLIDRFREDPECRIFLSTDAGATGLNLQSASLLINLDLPWNPAVLEQRIARIYRLGQTNPVQIINMVSRNTIEDRMLGTLRFKSDLAAGILDGGEDAVFFDKDKFKRIVEVAGEVVAETSPDETGVVSDEACGTSDEACGTSDEIGQEEVFSRNEGKAREDINEEKVSASGGKAAEIAHPEEHGNDFSSDRPDSSRKSDSATSSGKINSDAASGCGDASEPVGVPGTDADEVRRTVAGGLAALGKIAQMLRTPESTEAFVDAIVKEDPATGQTTLNIPVPDKRSVINILSVFSSFLGRK